MSLCEHPFARTLNHCQRCSHAVSLHKSANKGCSYCECKAYEPCVSPSPARAELTPNPLAPSGSVRAGAREASHAAGRAEDGEGTSYMATFSDPARRAGALPIPSVTRHEGDRAPSSKGRGVAKFPPATTHDDGGVVGHADDSPGNSVNRVVVGAALGVSGEYSPIPPQLNDAHEHRFESGPSSTTTARSR